MGVLKGRNRRYSKGFEVNGCMDRYIPLLQVVKSRETQRRIIASGRQRRRLDGRRLKNRRRRLDGEEERVLMAFQVLAGDGDPGVFERIIFECATYQLVGNSIGVS